MGRHRAPPNRILRLDTAFGVGFQAPFQVVSELEGCQSPLR